MKISTFIFLINSFGVIAQNTFKSPEAISEVKNEITVGVFPQVELISIIQTISKYSKAFGFLMSQDSVGYKTDVINHFMSYKNHPAVQMFERLSIRPGRFNFSAPSNIMLYTDKSLRLREDIELDDFVINRAGGTDSLRVFLNLLRDFAVQSSFNEFYQEHEDFYSIIIENTINNLESINYISELEAFYGKSQKSYNIVLVSLYSPCGFGNSLLYSNNQRELYNTIGAQKGKNNVPFFGDEKYLKYLIRHEFSHPFINPLTEKYWDYIKDYSHKFDSIPEKARKNVCFGWQECVNEFIIRSITTQLAYNESEESGLKSYKYESNRGVSYLDSLLKEIEYYQKNRKIYATFESYYQKILDVFKNE